MIDDKEDRNLELQDLAFVLQSAEGRRFVWRLMEISSPFKRSMDRTPEQTAFNDGRRIIGNTVFMDLMELDIGIYKIMKEEMERDSHARRQRNNERTNHV